MALLSGCFAVLGGLLAGIGIYGLLAYTVARRTNEIGIRIALGATAGRVIRMILKEASAIVAAGLVLGVPLAIWTNTLASRLVQDLAAQSGPLLALSAAAIVAVALVASFAPTRRAARVDPIESLRHE